MSLQTIAAAIRDIPDFPKPGIVFKDITPLLANPRIFRETVELMVAAWLDPKPDLVVGVDARGFIFGAAAAYELGLGFVPVRKRGKLPWQRFSAEYALEYGTDSVEMHVDAVAAGQRVLIVDDLLATGGTARAAASLIEQGGGEVMGIQALIELAFLEPRRALAPYSVESLIVVD